MSANHGFAWTRECVATGWIRKCYIWPIDEKYTVKSMSWPSQTKCWKVKSERKLTATRNLVAEELRRVRRQKIGKLTRYRIDTSKT